jgi:hypothetical protein
MPPNPHDLKHRVDALQTNVAGLFKLLGSHDPDERLRFWEILKGITSVATFTLVEHELSTINALVSQAEASTKTLMAVAKMPDGPAKATGH